MSLTLEVWDREPQLSEDCGGERVMYTGEVGTADETRAVFSVFLYNHSGNPEVFIDAIFGTWGDDDPASYADHVTFGSRTGFIDEHPHFASSLVQGAEMVAPEGAFQGDRLSRDRALRHPLLQEFWVVNDIILAGIEEIGQLFDEEA